MDKPRILLVDDEDYSVGSIREFLEMKGYDVVSAKDAEQGLEFLLDINPSPDMILLDYNMRPGMDGYEVSKKIRLDKKYCDFKNICIMGYGAFPETKREFLNNYQHKDDGPLTLIANLKICEEEIKKSKSIISKVIS